MFVGSNVSGVVSDRTVIVPPFFAPSTSGAGPFAVGSVALTWAPPTLLVSPLLPLFEDGLPQATAASMTVAVTAVIRFHCMVGFLLFCRWGNRRTTGESWGRRRLGPRLRAAPARAPER